MTLENIYYITQIIAVGVILISLVAIYWQQREANKMARVQNSSTLSTGFLDTLKDVMNNAELAAIYQKAVFKDEDLTSVEKTQILIHFNILVANHRNVWLAHENGLYDDAVFKMVDANTASYLRKPIFLNEWNRCCALGLFDGAFAEHVNSLIETPSEMPAKKPTETPPKMN